MPQHFDVIVAGGGGSGCLAASRLARAGLRVALVERGGPEPAALGSPSRLRDDPSLRLLDDPSEPAWPYRSSTGAPNAPYGWLRATGVGGRLNYWLGTSLRFEPHDFSDARAPELSWPITHGDLAPYYDELEGDLGLPHPNSGFPGDVVDGWLTAAAAACGVEARPVPQAETAREPGPEGRFRAFSPLDHWVPEAIATGRCHVMPFTVVSRVLTQGGKARGVEATAAGSGAVTLLAPVVMLATSTIETARVLLDSGTQDHPDGLGNQGHLVGERLMDHVVVWARAFVALPAIDWDPRRPLQSCYIPAWPGGGAERAAPSRFHVQVVVRDVTGVAPFPSGPDERLIAIALAGLGEGLPIPGNRVSVDPSRCRDDYGNAVPMVHFAWDEAHRRFARRIRGALLELLAALPCRVVAVRAEGEGDDDYPSPGGYGHEVGTARMGSDPSTSVTSPTCEVHGVENLFVVDGSPFVSYPDKNPTLTILANCARVCDEVLGRAGRAGR